MISKTTSDSMDQEKLKRIKYVDCCLYLFIIIMYVDYVCCVMLLHTFSTYHMSMFPIYVCSFVCLFSNNYNCKLSCTFIHIRTNKLVYMHNRSLSNNIPHPQAGSSGSLPTVRTGDTNKVIQLLFH